MGTPGAGGRKRRRSLSPGPRPRRSSRSSSAGSWPIRGPGVRAGGRSRGRKQEPQPAPMAEAEFQEKLGRMVAESEGREYVPPPPEPEPEPRPEPLPDAEFWAKLHQIVRDSERGPEPRRSRSRMSTRRSTRTWRPSATASGNCRPRWTPRTPGAPRLSEEMPAASPQPWQQPEAQAQAGISSRPGKPARPPRTPVRPRRTWTWKRRSSRPGRPIRACRRPGTGEGVPGPSRSCQERRPGQLAAGLVALAQRRGEAVERVGQVPVMPGEGALQVPVVLVAVDADPLGVNGAQFPDGRPVGGPALREPGR